MSLAVVILAAGQGVRMCSSLPKVLHTIGGRPILDRIISTVGDLPQDQILIVYGHEGEKIKEAFLEQPSLVWVDQEKTLGTGHAVLQALPFIEELENVLILYGDIPLIRKETLTHLLNTTPKKSMGLITVTLEDPTGFGRIVRDAEGNLLKIVEEKNASSEEKKIKEVNAGFFIVPKAYLQKWLPALSAKNAQQEYLLPDIVAMAQEQGVHIHTLSPGYTWEVQGINDKVQLAQLERIYQQEVAKYWMQQGVTMQDPTRFDVRGEVSIGKDVIIDVNVILEGRVILGNRVKVGPNVVLKEVTIGDDVEILANSVIEGAELDAHCVIGPFARIRPGTVLAEKVKIGNFVEIKKSTVKANSKINHLSYIGDATIGREVNIGAGTITCNFDGKNKHQTIIQDRVFIGSHTQLIAPVTVGEGATVGAGTTVTRDVASNHLVHNRLQRREIANWKKEDNT